MAVVVHFKGLRVGRGEIAGWVPRDGLPDAVVRVGGPEVQDTGFPGSSQNDVPP
jgi:hypothetical protein